MIYEQDLKQDLNLQETNGLPIETELLNYELPEELIAQSPCAERDSSRLLVLHRDTGQIEHRKFRDVAEYVRPGDVLVANDSGVFPARLFLKKETGARIEMLFLRPTGQGGSWEVLARPGRRLKAGDLLFHESENNPVCRMAVKKDRGLWTVEIFVDDLFLFLETHGITPLPPYIKKTVDDPDRYQTVYAKEKGSAAAPTAGLHFTPSLIEKIKSAGAEFAYTTLHIGLDTFAPITADFVEDHNIHTEFFRVPDETAKAVCGRLSGAGRVIAVGTTSVRALESWAGSQNVEWDIEGIAPHPGGAGGLTDIFIYRREHFHVVDAMITNFHLPKTTLLAMVCAFGGRELVLKAYQEAVNERYRFFSFGDAMLIL